MVHLSREPSLHLSGWSGSPPAPSDLDDLAALFSDESVTRTLGGPRDRESVERILEGWCRLWDERSLGPWIIRDRKGGGFVGYAGLGIASAGQPGELELLYAFLSENWGSGLATEAARACVEYAFFSCDLPELVGYTLRTNQASRRVLEKAGFRYEKEIVHANLPHAFYRCVREEDHDEFSVSETLRTEPRTGS